MKRITARAIIIENNKILSMYRERKIDGNLEKYYVFPGGGVNPNESLKDALIRELQEEMNLDIEVKDLVGTIEDNHAIASYFLCKIKSGHPQLGGEELLKSSPENYYEIKYIDITSLDKIDLKNKCILDKLDL